MNKLVSVIVPVFNREKTIRRCIDSILTQTHGDLELILVDDGSQDGTGLICDHYGRVDSRVRVFHNINHGVSYSRNYGLDHATGEYVIFVDSDDYINTSYIEHLLEKTENEFRLYSKEKIEKGNTETDYRIQKHKEEHPL